MIPRESKIWMRMPFVARKYFVILLMSFIFLLAFFPGDFDALWIFAVTLLVMALFETLFAFLVQRKTPGFKERFDLQEDHEYLVFKRSLFFGIYERYGINLARIFLWVIGFSFLVWMGGIGIARTTKDFAILDAQCPEMIVLRIYGDTMVTAPFDRQRKRVGQPLTILSLSKDTPMKLRKEYVGPLELTTDNIELTSFCDAT